MFIKVDSNILLNNLAKDFLHSKDRRSDSVRQINHLRKKEIDLANIFEKEVNAMKRQAKVLNAFSELSKAEIEKRFFIFIYF